jgi:phthalate 4,5-cis-dihydrodiol dehydrogenase
MPQSVIVYGDDARRIEELPPPKIPRSEVVDELYDAAVLGGPPLHSGEWGLATTEICLAILASAASGREVELHHQV